MAYEVYNDQIVVPYLSTRTFSASNKTTEEAHKNKTQDSHSAAGFIKNTSGEEAICANKLCLVRGAQRRSCMSVGHSGHSQQRHP